jgi:hypothetical protein
MAHLDPVWLGLAGTITVQVLFAVYVAGKWSERFERVLKWMDEEAQPQLDDHEQRIATIEYGTGVRR